MDVKTAFLKHGIDEDIYMKFPERVQQDLTVISKTYGIIELEETSPA